MRVPVSEYAAKPWRIHEIAPDFRVEDVWVLPTPGGPGELPRLVDAVFTGDFESNVPTPVALLWRARWKLGEVFGWDREQDGLDTRVPSLRDRLPDDLRDRPVKPSTFAKFRAVYQTDDEWVAELANKTVHALMHLCWVPDGDGGHTGWMAVLVKPAGLFGTAYMAAIKPFRYSLVYPALLRKIGRSWRDQASETRSA